MSQSGFIRLFIAAGSLYLGGCAMLGNYHSAKIADSGTSQVGLNIGWNSYAPLDSATDQAIQDSGITLPVFIPELAFSTALNERIEVGGRGSIQALGLEAYLKWGFFQGSHAFWAVAPTLGFRGAPYGQGFSSLPLLFTYQFSPRFGLHGSIFVSHSQVGEGRDKEL